MINVVHVTENPIAGAPINLSNALNKYQSDKVRSRHIAQSDRNENRVFDSDVVIDRADYYYIKDLLDKADVIHFHNFYQNQHLFRKYPEFWNIVMRKRRVWQAHSQRSTTWVDLEAGLRDKGAKHLVIGQYHPREWPECKVVPNIIDIWADKFMPDTSVNNEIPRVVYSPSRLNFKGWDNKGNKETIPILQKLVDERVITAEVIFNKPHAECLAKRKKADISIDEIVTGSYHLCSLESLAAGLITIANLDDLQVETLVELTGCDKDRLPWQIDDQYSLYYNIKIMADNKQWMQVEKQYAREWMEKYWCPKIMTDKFVKIYEGL